MAAVCLLCLHSWRSFHTDRAQRFASLHVNPQQLGLKPAVFAHTCLCVCECLDFVAGAQRGLSTNEMFPLISSHLCPDCDACLVCSRCLKRLGHCTGQFTDNKAGERLYLDISKDPLLPESGETLGFSFSFFPRFNQDKYCQSNRYLKSPHKNMLISVYLCTLCGVK